MLHRDSTEGLLCVHRIPQPTQFITHLYYARAVIDLTIDTTT